MSGDPIDQSDNDSEGLSIEWVETALNASHNLGFEHALSALSAEHWQMVLTSVAARMQMRGVSPPFGWKAALARQVGRPIPESEQLA